MSALIVIDMKWKTEIIYTCKDYIVMWRKMFDSNRSREFSSNVCVQTSSGANPASYTVGTGGSFPGGKVQLGHDADHSPPCSAKVKKE
jgi:hypothetical protein